jgi:hypothetical protein
MTVCPACRGSHEAPSVAQLIAEDEVLTTQTVLEAAVEKRMEKLCRAWLVFALRGLGYCQQCIFSKGLVIAGEVAAVAVSSPTKSPEQIEAEHLGLNEPTNLLHLGRRRSRPWVGGVVRPGELISNHELFRRATDGFPGPNDDGMPKRGA